VGVAEVGAAVARPAEAVGTDAVVGGAELAERVSDDGAGAVDGRPVNAPSVEDGSASSSVGGPGPEMPNATDTTTATASTPRPIKMLTRPLRLRVRGPGGTGSVTSGR
jgi:hypothetical protein